MIKYRVKYPYPNSKREIEYRGERAYFNEYGLWVTYRFFSDGRNRKADTLNGIKMLIDAALTEMEKLALIKEFCERENADDAE